MAMELPLFWFSISLKIYVCGRENTYSQQAGSQPLPTDGQTETTEEKDDERRGGGGGEI